MKKVKKIMVPASSANLGSGFDSIGLCLDLWNEMFGRLKPAVMDGYQYTFPSNRIITGLNFMSGEVLDENDNKKTSQAQSRRPGLNR